MALKLLKVKNQKTLDNYIGQFVLEGAKAMFTVGEYDTCEAAFKASRASVEYYFPKNTCPKTEHVLSMHDDETGNNVGQIWLSVLKDIDKTRVFLSYIMVDEEYKRKGYATQALPLMEDYVKNVLKVNRIEFYAFVNNPVAFNMYIKHGYTIYKKQFFGYATDTTRNVMAKDL